MPYAYIFLVFKILYHAANPIPCSRSLGLCCGDMFIKTYMHLFCTRIHIV